MNQAKIKSTLLKALQDAGSLVKESLFEGAKVSKKSEISLVTEIDHEAERLIIDLIKKEHPGHAILAEESEPSGQAEERWIIDPIDGTTNFVHTFPFSAVSIAYEENGVLKMGGVFEPFHDELFFAEKGKGAFLNGVPITISKTKTLSESLLATGFPYDRKARLDEYLKVLKAFLLRIQGIRRMGSAALDLCHVACGRFDGYWESSLCPWDIAAGALILQEAGGLISDYSGNAFSIHGSETLATNGLIHNEMLEVFKQL